MCCLCYSILPGNNLIYEIASEPHPCPENRVTIEELDILPDKKVSTEILLTQIAEGDRQSEEELLSRHWRGLYFILFQRTHDPDLAADLAQETFLIVIQKARSGGIEKPSGFAGFIRQTGINLMKAHYRKESRRATDTQSEIEVLIPDDSPSLYQQFQSKNMLELVRQLMEELPTARDREILENYFIHEREKQELCELLGVSPGVFDTVLQRARKRLKNLVNQKLEAKPNHNKKVSSKLINKTLLVLLMAEILHAPIVNQKFIDSQVKELGDMRHLYIDASENAAIQPTGKNYNRIGNKSLEV